MNARPSCVLLVLLTAVLLAGGCSGGVEDLVARPEVEKAPDALGDAPPSPPAQPPPPPSSAKEPVARQPDAASGKDETTVEPPAVPPTTTVLQPPAAKPQAAPPHVGPSTGQPSIRLSMGVALAQTLPTGTAMGFSVEYEFTRGGPNPSLRYVWVIEPTKGQPVKFMGPLKNRDTLQVFVQHWRPENGPFESHIEDANGNRLSRSISLR